jgi:hypothetical protein
MISLIEIYEGAVENLLNNCSKEVEPNAQYFSDYAENALECFINPNVAAEFEEIYKVACELDNSNDYHYQVKMRIDSL